MSQTRNLHPGMGQAVGERTILRYYLSDEQTKKLDSARISINPADPNYQRWNVAALNSGLHVEVSPDAPFREAPEIRYETWEDVAERVAFGNSSLAPKAEQLPEFEKLFAHLRKATTLMSGRHLQHGDYTQRERPMEVFTNCATAATTFAKFYLLLNGSGVGRDYSDDLMLVNWDHAPALRCVLDHTHPDFDYSAHESVRDAKHKYKGKDVMWFAVPDSREGWAQAIEVFENAAFEKIHSHKMLILDFSNVRGRGAPIKGMQNRPSSGPVPLMNALLKVASLKGGGMPLWLQAMYADHYVAECVLVGGARRAARMATKHWLDKSSIFDFIACKRPIEYEGATMDEVIEFRKDRPIPPESFLWSSNNSVLVDEEFWMLVNLKRGSDGYDTDRARHARKVFKFITEYSYGDGTGEPGIINVDRLTSNQDGLREVAASDYLRSSRFAPRDDSSVYMNRVARRVVARMNNGLSPFIVNPCGEIVLSILGAFCTIADVVPYHCDTIGEAMDAFRTTTRALMRVNLMESIYDLEVKRTNRIGVGMTGVHEFAWKFFKVGFRDLINPDLGFLNDIAERPPQQNAEDPSERAAAFWLTLRDFHHAVIDEAERYAKHLGVAVPHTALTIKPAGTTSKLFGLTEGWHLPAMAHFLRWVQFRSDDPLVDEYQLKHYPVRELRTYEGTRIVGFPTQPVIAQLGLGDALVTASEATPEEQYRWLKLGERFYIEGGSRGDPWGPGNQISYTLKYDPEKVDYAHFRDMLKKHQSGIKCCSVMPQADTTAYEYQPEEPITKATYEEITARLSRRIAEDVDKVHVDCDAGACPIDFEENK